MCALGKVSCFSSYNGPFLRDKLDHWHSHSHLRTTHTHTHVRKQQQTSSLKWRVVRRELTLVWKLKTESALFHFTAFTSFLPLKDHSSTRVCFFSAHECLCTRTCSKLLTHSLYKASSVLQQLENKSIVTTSVKHWIMISMLLPNVLFSCVCVCVCVCLFSYLIWCRWGLWVAARPP